MKKTNLFWVVVVILLIVAVIAFYLYDVIALDADVTENLFRTLAIICLLIGTLSKLLGGGRKGLEIYEKAYTKELAGAFEDQPLLRKKLLCACRLYNESNYAKALKYLFQLLKDAKTDNDVRAVLLFVALCYSDAKVPGEAKKAYLELWNRGLANAQVHSNLGLIYIGEGDYETARYHYNQAIELDPNNHYAFVNRGNYFFRIEEYDLAIEDAKKALAIKNNCVEAASLLTIIYAIRKDEENKKKYFHIAITSGKKPEDLNDAIRYYTIDALETQADDEEV